MKPAFVLRLLKYQAALATFTEESRGAGVAYRTLAIEASDLARATSVPLDEVKRDLARVGFHEPHQIPVSSAEVAIDVMLRSREMWRLEPEVPQVRPEMNELGGDLYRLPANIELAEAREKAWAVASDHSNCFGLSLGAFTEGRAPKLHQFNTLRSVFTSLAPNAVIADEVGLGKTVTSGMVLMELIERRLVSSCLLIVPTNLRTQWEEEFRKFFDFEFASISVPGEETTHNVRDARFVLADYRQVREEPYSSQLLARNWDLLMLDEAHRLRNADTQQSTVCFSIRAAFRLFLTATPVHNSAMDIYHMATQLQPGFLGTEPSFKDYFIGESNEIVNGPYLRERLGKIQVRTKRAATLEKFAKRVVETVDVSVSHDERELYSSLLGFLQSVKKYYPGSVELGRGTAARETQSIVVVAINALRQLSSHPKNTIESLRTTFRDRVSASPIELRDSSELKRIDELVDKYARTDWISFKHSKTEKLLQVVNSMLKTANKIVIYAEFIPTAKILKDRLAKFFAAKETAKVFLLYGAMSRTEKDSVVRDFKGAETKAILVSTDCGGEGLNLQCASGIINFDFPWNPMKVEQRIGRIDRIGQPASDIFIWNLVTRGTIERYVYNTLQGKLKICDEIMGDYFDSIITRMVVWQSHSELGIGQIIMTSGSPEELSKRIDELDRPPSERFEAKAKRYGRQSRIKF
ncbi:DEAD/DEAH box helicase [Bradyrhizobium brasilense]|uniref:DEAD/DEAH box helicase n=1 Tax=Bradyrhizobium brasilense TaxID=1419277 RepID=UPI002877C7E3|nr:DEAD/DEAH box helicase [Bradyrhizobium brasilense]MCP3415733.1 DEAD/DEAH box helicase [Bradyrhizobium brasilense]